MINSNSGGSSKNSKELMLCAEELKFFSKIAKGPNYNSKAISGEDLDEEIENSTSLPNRILPEPLPTNPAILKDKKLNIYQKESYRYCSLGDEIKRKQGEDLHQDLQLKNCSERNDNIRKNQIFSKTSPVSLLGQDHTKNHYNIDQTQENIFGGFTSKSVKDDESFNLNIRYFFSY